MSCGQSAWADELAERASTEHEARLKAIPISVLADTVDKLTDQFRYHISQTTVSNIKLGKSWTNI